MTNNMNILSKENALSYYNKVCKICSSPDEINNKVLNFGTILESLFKEITSNDMEHFATLFDRQNFVGNKYGIGEEITDSYHKLRKLSNNIRHDENFNVNNVDYTKSVERLITTINYFSDSTFPTDSTVVSIPKIGGKKEEGMIVRPINPNTQCKVFVFNIGKFLKKRTDLYDATRHWWKITEEYLDVSKYEFAIGLVKGISVSAYKLTKWTYIPHKGRYEFEGSPAPEFFINCSWHKEINVGYWQFGNHLVVEFDGKGKFQLIKPNKEGQWINCV